MLDNDKRIILINNKEIFENAIRNYEKYFDDMFGGSFGHCTREGNRLLAENIADAILDKTFLNK